MSTALALRLIASGAVSAAEAEAALLSSLARRTPFVRALIDTGAIGEALLDAELEQLGGMGLRQVAGMPELVNRLPPHFCRRMGVLPLRVDHGSRVVEVAAADPLDPHVAAEVAFHLGVPVRVLRAPIAAIEDAIRRIELEAEAAAGRARRATPPFPHGAPDSSNPPPPPLEPTPIPLVRRTGPGLDKPPDTLRLYKQTLRPTAGGPADLDFSDAPGQGAPPAETAPRGTAPRETAPPAQTGRPRRTSRPPQASHAANAASQGEGQTPPQPAQRRKMTPLTTPAARLWDVRGESEAAASPTPSPSPSPSPAPPATVAGSPRVPTFGPRPAAASSKPDKSTAPEPPRAPPRAEAADDAPLSAMVPQAAAAAAPSAEPPAVSFPSMPPPSIADQPGLLPADADWSGDVPAAEPKPEPTPLRQQRRPSRFARPSIDIQLPQPPSESRARRPRTSLWDVPAAGGEVREEAAPAPPVPPPEPTPPEPARPSRYETLDTSAVLDALRGAPSRDDVVVAALRGLRTVGRRAAIFVVRRDGFHGWACNVELGEQEKLRGVSVPGDAPSLFATAVATGTYFGPVPDNAVHAGLLRVLEQPATDVAVSVARAGGKPVMVLFADDLVDAKRRVLPRLVEISDAVGAALSRLLAARL